MTGRQDEFRRRFLLQGARLAGLAGLSLAFPGAAQSRSAAYPFALGVASGSPRADSVVLWTRLAADPLSAEPFSPGPVQVRWELAADENFRQVLRSGEATALGGLAHSVHVEPSGLQPDRWYWYRFMLGDAVSPVGRTRTAPAADALPGARVLPGRFNVVQMAIGVRQRSASAIPAIDDFVNRTRSDGTVQKAIAEAGLRGVRVP